MEHEVHPDKSHVYNATQPYTEAFAENATVPPTIDSKYVRLCPDRRLKWRKDVMLKRQELSLRIRQIFQLLRKKSRVSKGDKFYSLQNNLRELGA